MSFLNPLLLLGSLAIVLPIVAHMLNRYEVKQTDWAAMQFLKGCDAIIIDLPDLDEVLTRLESLLDGFITLVGVDPRTAGAGGEDAGTIPFREPVMGLHTLAAHFG